MNVSEPFDILGIGAGPANLSLAALATRTDLKTLFFDKQANYAWHEGLLLPEARMQTSYLKDLVTCVDPTNPFGFLNHLVRKKRLYSFLAGGQQTISRQEFSQYLQWAVEELPNVQLDEAVESIDVDGDYFVVNTQKQSVKTRHIASGVGMQPYTPPCADAYLAADCFHASTIKQSIAQLPQGLHGLRVAIIGGGQTGADVFQTVFSGTYGKPSHVAWVSRRANLEALDEGVFTDEYFTPNYVNYFHQLPESVKRSEIERQKLTSDGITSECLQQLYQMMYFDRFVEQGDTRWDVHCHSEMTKITKTHQHYQLSTQHQLTGKVEVHYADVVILCTGYRRRWPRCLHPFIERAEKANNGGLQLNSDYSLRDKHAQAECDCLPRIFMMNAGIESHGIADPQLSLISWRAAQIINAIKGERFYDTEHSTVLKWGEEKPHVIQDTSPNRVDEWLAPTSASSALSA